MFEYIRSHQRLMMLLLLLIIFPSFAFVGLESYMRMGGGRDVVAKVDGQDILQQEFDAVQREQRERARQMFGDEFDLSAFDTPQARKEILNNLITRRVLALEAYRSKLTVSDQTLQQTIGGMAGLRLPDGTFDLERYRNLLAEQGRTPAMFEAGLRLDMSIQQINAAIQNTAFVPLSISQHLAQASEQERQAQQLVFKREDYEKQVQATDEMLQSYYAKSNEFDVPERVKAEYVVLSADALASQVTVSDADVAAYYEQNKSHYATPERRLVAHILIAVDRKAPQAEKTAAKEKAEKLLNELKQSSQQFAQLAKSHSDDPYSAERGGVLGTFSVGMMGNFKYLEEAAFKLKQDEVSDLVQSDFGYHIVRASDIKPAALRTLAEVKTQITNDIRRQQAARKFAELTEVFNDTVYEQSDSLRAVAEKLQLDILTVEDLSRQGKSEDEDALYNNPRFLTALFSDDALRNKRNTESVQVGANTLIAGRVVEHTPNSKKPFETVKETVREQVIKREALALAKAAGLAKLAELKKQDDATGFSSTQAFSRAKAQGVHPELFVAVMKADTAVLPTFVGVELPEQGYSVVRVVRVIQPDMDENRQNEYRQAIEGMLAQEETQTYIEVLKERAKVKIVKPLETASKDAEPD